MKEAGVVAVVVLTDKIVAVSVHHKPDGYPYNTVRFRWPRL